MFGKLFKKTAISADDTPDLPQPFGYKTTWYAVKDETPQSVIDKLRLRIAAYSNWSSGLEHVQKGSEVFVSPQVGDYVLVIGLHEISPNVSVESAQRHAALFNELQYFGNHRVSDYYAWAKFSGGELIRAYEYSGDDGVMVNAGEITAEEIALSFDKFPASEPTWTDGEMLPDEESVIAIAKAWGVDPEFGGGGHEKSTGYICRLPGKLGRSAMAAFSGVTTFLIDNAGGDSDGGGGDFGGGGDCGCC